MAAAVIGALRANLSLNSAAFDKGLGNARKQLGGFGSTAKKAFAAVAVAAAGVATAIGAGMKRTIGDMDTMGRKASQSLGIPVAELTRLRHAADISGVAFESLSTGIKRMSRNMADVAQGAGAGAKRAFDALGISVTNADGSMRNNVEIMKEMATRFKGLEDGTAKTALAIQLFGRSGADLIPMLNQGADGLEAMMQEADKLGIVFDSKTAKAAEAFQDNLTRLARVKDGMIIQLTSHMLPALERLSAHFVEGAMNGGWLQKAVDGIKLAMDGATRAVILVYDNMAILVRVAASFIAVKIGAAVVSAGIAFVKFAATIRTVGAMLAGLNIIKLATNRGFLIQAGLIALLVGQWDNLKGVVERFTGEISKLLPEGVMGSVSTGLRALGLDVRGLEMDLQALETGAGTDMPAALEQLNLALDNTATKRKGLSEAEKEHNALMEEGARLTEAMRTPQEALAASIDRINLLFRAGAIDAETYQRALAAAAESSASNWDGAAQSIIGSFQTIANNFGQVSSRMAKAGQAFGIAQALINAYQAASKALATYAPPFSYIAAAAALAQGMSYVASIRSQNIPKFAHGGSFQVGGIGGTDSQLVQFMASPDERVTVETPGQQRNGQTSTIRLVSDLDSVYSFDHLRALVRRLNEYGRDNGMPRLELVPA